MSNLDWQPASGYGVCFIAICNGLIFNTYKTKSGYYHFSVQRIGNGKQPPKTIYDSRVDAFVEKTTRPDRIKEVAGRWLRIHDGQR